MKRLLSGLVAVALLGSAACNKSEPGGGTARADSFTLKAPMMATSLKQGDTHTVSLSIDRGKEFKQDVKLSSEKLPQGLTVEFSPASVKASEKAEADMKITAAKNAAVGEHTITVKGTPEKGSSTTVDVKVKVEESK